MSRYSVVIFFALLAIVVAFPHHQPDHHEHDHERECAGHHENDGHDDSHHCHGEHDHQAFNGELGKFLYFDFIIITKVIFNESKSFICYCLKGR